LVESIWCDYKDSHRRYNSWENEWDISETFDPSALIEAYAEDEEDYNHCDYFPSTDAAPEPEAAPPLDATPHEEPPMPDMWRAGLSSLLSNLE
jgi:hypothetical protein